MLLAEDPSIEGSKPHVQVDIRQCGIGSDLHKKRIMLHRPRHEHWRIQPLQSIVRRFHSELWSGNVSVVDELLADEYKSNMGEREEIKSTASGALASLP